MVTDMLLMRKTIHLSNAWGGAPPRYSRAGSLNTSARCHARNSAFGKHSFDLRLNQTRAVVGEQLRLGVVAAR